MPDQKILVLEFDEEVLTASGLPAGTRRGWVGADDLPSLPAGARVLLTTDDLEQLSTANEVFFEQEKTENTETGFLLPLFPPVSFHGCIEWRDVYICYPACRWGNMGYRR